MCDFAGASIKCVQSNIHLPKYQTYYSPETSIERLSCCGGGGLGLPLG